MRTRKLGNTELDVSILGLGTLCFGTRPGPGLDGLGVDPTDAKALLSAAADAGVTLIDTANVYGKGEAETIIGDWFHESRLRERMVLATKVGFPISPGPNASGASARHVVEATEGCLKRLRTDHIDLLFIHIQDELIPEQETLTAIDGLARAGKVLHAGASNYSAHRLVDAAWIAKTGGLIRYAALSSYYNLGAREIEFEHMPACVRHGIGIVAWGALGGGFFTGKYERGRAVPAGSRLDRWHPGLPRLVEDRAFSILEIVRATARAIEATPAQVALAWLLQRPAVSTALFGARSIAQLEDVVKAADLVLPAEAVDALDRVSQPELPHPYRFHAFEARNARE